MENLAFAPALALASKIRHKDISARELLEFYLQRVERYNPRLNAIIFRQDAQARQRADAADAAARTRGGLGTAAWRAHDH